MGSRLLEMRGLPNFYCPILMNVHATYLEVPVFEGRLDFLDAEFWVSTPNSCPSLITAIRLAPFSRIVFNA